MATVIPIGGQIPVEPVRLPPANPAEEAELNNLMIAQRWHQWRYTGYALYSRNPDGSQKLIQITGVDIGMINARLKGVFGSWPLPGEYGSSYPPAVPANCAYNANGTPMVQQYPA
jgi:hypothetical protein